MKTNFRLLLNKLIENNFDFVLIGGFAAAAYGSSYVTYDLDICAVLSPEKINHLRDILKDTHPKHRITLQKPSFLDVPDDLIGINNLYLETDVGVLDIITNVSGIGNFEEVSRSAIEIQIFGHKCKVISLDDLIKAKLTLKRPKDLVVANELELIRDRSKNST
jgi:predicted nucleotidyltransferase